MQPGSLLKRSERLGGQHGRLPDRILHVDDGGRFRAVAARGLSLPSGADAVLRLLRLVPGGHPAAPDRDLRQGARRPHAALQGRGLLLEEH